MRMAKPVLRALPDYLDFLEHAPATLLKTLGMFSSGKFQVEMLEKKIEKKPQTPLWKLWIPFAALTTALLLLPQDAPLGGELRITPQLQMPVASAIGFAIAAWYGIRYWRHARK